MAEEKETILIDLKIDKGETEKNLDAVTKAIGELVEDTKKLTAANKELEKQGETNSQAFIDNTKQIAINREELNKHQQVSKSMVVALQTESNSLNALSQRNKELTKERNNLNLATKAGIDRLKQINEELDKNNATIKENVSALEKQKIGIGGYETAIRNALKEAGPMGQAVEGQIDSFTKLLNPLTAVAAGLAGLAALYVKSAAGANDLRNAQNNLKASTAELSNFLFKQSEDGLGPLERGSKRLQVAIINLTSLTKEDATARKDRLAIANIELKTLKELEIEQIQSAASFKKAEQEAENLRRKRDNAELTYSERLQAVKDIEDKLKESQDVRTSVVERQLKALQSYGENVGSIVNGEVKDLELKEIILQKEAELADLREEVNGKATENIMAKLALEKEAAEQSVKIEQERLANIQLAQHLANEDAATSQEDRLEQLRKSTSTEAQISTEGPKYVADVNKQLDKKIQDGKKESSKIKEEIDKKDLANTSLALGQATTLFKENSNAHKLISSGKAVIDTYSAANQALATGGPILGPILAAIAIAVGLKNVATINAVQFAKGGRADNGVKWGTVGGRPHSQGGTKYYGEDGHVVELEHGEGWYVGRPNVHNKFISGMSRMNELDGGHSWVSERPVRSYALGGSVYIPGNSQAAIDYNRLAQAISQQQIFVTVEDINAGQNRVSETAQQARVL